MTPCLALDGVLGSLRDGFMQASPVSLISMIRRYRTTVREKYQNRKITTHDTHGQGIQLEPEGGWVGFRVPHYQR